MKFSILNQSNAQDFFDLYMKRKDSVLLSFKETLAANSGPAAHMLDNSPESLIPLWTWLRHHLPHTDKPPALDQVPPWYSSEVVEKGFKHMTAEVACLLDGFAYYYGDVRIKNLPGLSWQIGRDKPVRLGSYCPLVRGKYLSVYPLHMALVATAIANKSNDERNTDDSEYRVFRMHEEAYESAKAYYHARGDFSLEETPHPPQAKKSASKQKNEK